MKNVFLIFGEDKNSTLLSGCRSARQFDVACNSYLKNLLEIVRSDKRMVPYSTPSRLMQLARKLQYGVKKTSVTSVI